MIRVYVKPGAEEEILALARNGAEIIHLSADTGGRGAKGERSSVLETQPCAASRGGIREP